MTHICVNKLTIIGSDNGLSPGRRQAIIWTNDGILLIRTFRTHFSEIVSEIHTFLFMKMRLKVSSAKWRPFCLGLNVLKPVDSAGYLADLCNTPARRHTLPIFCLFFFSRTNSMSARNKPALTHWGQNKIATTLRVRFPNSFSSVKIFVFLFKF